MADRGHRRPFTSGCLLFFLGLYNSSATPVTSIAVRPQATRGTGDAPLTTLGVSCSKGICRGCDLSSDQTTRSNSLPQLVLCGRNVPPQGPHFRFRPLIRRRSGDPTRDLSSTGCSSGVALTSSGSRSNPEMKKRSSWDVEGGRAGLPVGSEGMEMQFTKRFLFRSKNPPRKPQTIEAWPRQTWRNLKPGKKWMTSQGSKVKRPDRNDLSSKKSVPVRAIGPAAPPHRWSVFFIGKRPHK